MKQPDTRLIVVSNRLPLAVVQEDEKWSIKPGAGGLVTALAPVLMSRRGVWIGWPGTKGIINIDQLLHAVEEEVGYALRSVILTRDEVRGFYEGFSNEIIWPLFHGFEARCRFVPDYWRKYLEVNLKFAKTVARHCRDTDYIWVHDYHLMHIGFFLKRLLPERRAGFFLHIPFPPIDAFVKLPWRMEILMSLLEYDLVGFQTARDRRNFIQCLQQMCSPDVRISGRGGVITVHMGTRKIRVGAFPISIDFHDFERRAQSEEVAKKAWYLHENFPERQIALGIDRLDYTKGIPERLEAFRVALQRFPELHGKISLVQVVIPSRQDVLEYGLLKAEIERLVGEINGQFTRPGWIPIHFLYRSLSKDELVAYYRTAEICLVTPLKDGMNLVSKEYCACSLEENSVLILSEFAGAAAQLQRGALLVNPYDVTRMAEALHQAFYMDQAERRSRMRKQRDIIRRHDIFWWVDSVLEAAFAKRLDDFAQVEEYVPELIKVFKSGRQVGK